MSEKMANPLRMLPSVDQLLRTPAGLDLIRQYGRSQMIDALQVQLDSTRTALRAQEPITTDAGSILKRTAHTLESSFRPTLRAVINATGVIIHTNLGRAPLSLAAQEAVREVAAQYNTLEFDLEEGKRGSRLVHAGKLITEITGAEAALVVNNNAAGLVLLLSSLAKDREVIISRGQLIEIGGGFRVPEVMEQSGAKLVEVGATNRTHASDYARAITPNTALLMHAHASNFKMVGFTESVALNELAEIAHRHNLYLVDDLGSGALLDTARFGLEHEPTVQESLQAGVDLVAFSGDKLLGGPQAGILAGKKALIDLLKQHPLARAIRADKLCLAGLGATLDHYRKGDALEQIPVWRMIAQPLERIRETARHWAQQVGGAVIEGESTIGGGSLPGATLPTALLALDIEHPDEFMARLRHAHPPVIARIAGGQVLFDPRTVLPGQENLLIDILSKELVHEIRS
jgi:L-seryl-tRNA(Ser) seleniumtransferase